MDLGETTVFIGPNNAGKTAILDAIRIVLSRRWGQRGTGFTENDVHRAKQDGDPRTLPPVTITLVFEEPQVGVWDSDMVAALEDILTVSAEGRNLLTLRVTCSWSQEREAFDPVWQFLDSAGMALPEKRRAINLSGFFNYVPIFWLSALRDATDEFTPRSGRWGRLLKSVRIPDKLEAEALRILAELDERIVAADPRLRTIADQIGQATQVAVGEGPGAARVNTLPIGIEEMLQRTGITIRNEEFRPWLPLSHHGQGLQSLAVIFLFQAAVLQQLNESDRTGVEAVFAIEEPEAHLHPQAARTLWDRVSAITGQKLITTHSPYFVHHVPLRQLRIARLRNGQTEISAIPEPIVSELPWNTYLDGLVQGPAKQIVFRDQATNRVGIRSWFNEQIETDLQRCYRNDEELVQRRLTIRDLRHRCRVMPTDEDEIELGFHGRRIRGEIFFARRWILVEGVTEYLLLHALGKALRWPLDTHGVSVIDFQQSGGAGIYATLGEAFGIPWHVIVDGDREGDKIRQQILDRGFTDEQLLERFFALPQPNTLETQLIVDGHLPLLRQILSESMGDSALNCTEQEFRARLNHRKTSYMHGLCNRVISDEVLAKQMPAVFVNLVTNLRDGS